MLIMAGSFQFSWGLAARGCLFQRRDSGLSSMLTVMPDRRPASAR